MGWKQMCGRAAAALGFRPDEPRGTPRQVANHLNMRRWGIEDKLRYGDNTSFDQGQYNRPLMRPAASRFALNRTMRFVAPDHKTPWPSVNWIPTPPHRTNQVTKSGGRQPQQPGLITTQVMQSYKSAFPVLQSGLSSFGERASNVLAGGYHGTGT